MFGPLVTKFQIRISKDIHLIYVDFLNRMLRTRVAPYIHLYISIYTSGYPAFFVFSIYGIAGIQPY